MLSLVNGSVRTRDGRKIAEKRLDVSALRKGDFGETGNLWNIDGRTVSLRLPWTLLNVTDPSSLQVLQDPRKGYFNAERDTLKTVDSDGFLFEAIVWNRAGGTISGRLESDPAEPFVWAGWESAPPWKERLKKSYYILKDAWAGDAKADGAEAGAAKVGDAKAGEAK